jgi:hypothetical protein
MSQKRKSRPAPTLWASVDMMPMMRAHDLTRLEAQQMLDSISLSVSAAMSEAGYAVLEAEVSEILKSKSVK